MNTGVAWPIDSTEAWARVLGCKPSCTVGRWPIPAAASMMCSTWSMTRLSVAAAWDRVRTNTGARTAGVDQIAPRSITSARAVSMLADLRDR